MQYRITRPNKYGPRSAGRKSLDAREGHYIEARTPAEARKKYRTLESLAEREPLDVQDWGHGKHHGEIAVSRDAQTEVTTYDDSAFIRTALKIKSDEEGSIDILNANGERVLHVNIFLGDDILILDAIDVDGIWPHRMALTFRSPTDRERIAKAGSIISADFRKTSSDANDVDLHDKIGNSIVKEHQP